MASIPAGRRGVSCRPTCPGPGNTPSGASGGAATPTPRGASPRIGPPGAGGRADGASGNGASRISSASLAACSSAGLAAAGSASFVRSSAIETASPRNIPRRLATWPNQCPRRALRAARTPPAPPMGPPTARPTPPAAAAPRTPATAPREAVRSAAALMNVDWARFFRRRRTDSRASRAAFGESFSPARAIASAPSRYWVNCSPSR